MEQRLGWDLIFASLCLSLALSSAVAWSYAVTHAGISYVRSYMQSLAVSGVLSALVMLAIGDDVARGLGVVGALTIIRFRTTLKDTRDLLHMFAALGAGMACGVRAFGVATAGVGLFIAANLVMHLLGLGTRTAHGGVLRFRAPGGNFDAQALEGLLGRHCQRATLLNVRQVGDIAEHSYLVELRGAATADSLVSALSALPSVTGVSLMLHAPAVEP